MEEESTRTVMAALREVIETKGLFCALYSDRGKREDGANAISAPGRTVYRRSCGWLESAR